MIDLSVHASGTPLEWIITIVVVVIAGGFLGGFFGAMGRDLAKLRKH